jgi:hypothetical protein
MTDFRDTRRRQSSAEISVKKKARVRPMEEFGMKNWMTVVIAGLVMGAGAWAQKPPLLAEKDAAAIAAEISGETAKGNLEGIARFHRQRGSKGFHEAAELVAERLRAYGLSGVAILQFPADGKIFYGTQRSRPGWDADVGDLWEIKIVREAGNGPSQKVFRVTELELVNKPCRLTTPQNTQLF